MFKGNNLQDRLWKEKHLPQNLNNKGKKIKLKATSLSKLQGCGNKNLHLKMKTIKKPKT
jgi:hypothetical protein